MSPATLSDYIPVLLTIITIFAVAALIFFVGFFAGPNRPSPQKLAPFESGQEISTNPRNRFSVKFYLVAIFFIAFDVEAVFMYPWAVVYLRENMDRAVLLGEVFFFLSVLTLGLAYVWKKGALEWD